MSQSGIGGAGTFTPWGMFFTALALGACVYGVLSLGTSVFEPHVAAEVRSQMARAGFEDARVRVVGQRATVRLAVQRPMDLDAARRLHNYVRDTECNSIIGRIPCTRDVVLEIEAPDVTQ
ncbi:MAG: hypothetical protein AAFQ82_07655 [Myxococcota bacterium]